ncbi:binding partner of ACD11 1 isoform X2 [Salvia miltiorrhiza]|uniref:binding partner of ACD11 1 isoform X2 n=1 Tax=Salvia miltiorrhiza TaxID=226208 RepID=UPI0025AD4B7A|nr:binding partner of ACD11 1 isoform X2 [Salvia miltiorrhiza]
MDHTETIKGELQPTSPSWTIDVSDIRTIKVSNVSLDVSERDIFELFTFSGNIQYIEMQRESETTQVAYVTFMDPQDAERAALLTSPKSSAVKKAEDVVSTMLARGFVLGKDGLRRAKSLDEKHKLTVNALATVASLDRRIGLSEKLSMGTAAVNEKVREMDELLQVSDMTKSAYAAAEEKASSAGSAIMNNRYVLTGASWVTNAYIAVTKAAEDVGAMTMEKVEKAEEEKRETLRREGEAIYSQFINASRRDLSPALPITSAHASSNHF